MLPEDPGAAFGAKVIIIFIMYFCLEIGHCQNVAGSSKLEEISDIEWQPLFDSLRSSSPELINFLEESYQLQSHETIMKEFLSNLLNCTEIDLTRRPDQWLSKFAEFKNKQACFARLVFQVLLKLFFNNYL